MRRRLARVIAAALALGACRTPPSPTADAVLAEARHISQSEGPHRAIPVFERAVNLYRRSADRHGEAVALGNLGTAFKNLGDYPRALELQTQALSLKRALGDHEEAAKSLSNLGLVHKELGQYAQALARYDEALADFSRRGSARGQGAVLNNRAQVYDELGEYEKAMSDYERAIALCRAAEFESCESDALGNIGGDHLLLGRYADAAARYTESLAIDRRLDDLQKISLDLGNLAAARLGLGQVDEAVRTYGEALALAERGGLAKERADWLMGLAAAHLQAGRHDAARASIDTALQVYERAGLRQSLVEALVTRSTWSIALGDLAGAREALARAADLSRALGHPRGVASARLSLGDVEQRLGRPAAASDAYTDARRWAESAGDRALRCRAGARLAEVRAQQGDIPGATRDAEQALADAKASASPSLEAEALMARGNVAVAAGHSADALERFDQAARKSGDDPELQWRAAFGRGAALERLDRLDEAIAAYLSAVGTIEQVQSRLREQRDRAGYLERKQQVYAALVRVLLRAHRAADAFSAAERLRASSYQDLLLRALSSATPAGHAAEAALQARIRQLQRAIAAERERPTTMQRTAALDTFSTELASAEREYLGAIDRGRERLGLRAGMAQTPTAAQIQAALGHGQVLLQYVVTEDGIAAFVVGRDTLHAMMLPGSTRALRDRVDLLRALIVRSSTDDWRTAAASLYEHLVAPLEAQGWLTTTKQLFIVPHGELHYLPFAALWHGTPSGPRYLIDGRAIAVLPAAAALLDSPPRRAPPAGTVLALAPARARLPYAGGEAAQAVQAFSSQGRVLLGTAATESAFKRASAGFRVLHLATHGVFNQVNPLFSGMELEADGEDDGRLQVFEILGLRLNTDLVVLSACDTALGTGQVADVPAGEDFVGLTRAFLSAGSRSVLASLWAVSDSGTPPLMQRFYQGLRTVNRAEALADAQRSLRDGGGKYAHPYYWAAFELVGVPR
jgi:CHAT domain-containing protein/Flp pilus assembly protein TadD